MATQKTKNSYLGRVRSHKFVSALVILVLIITGYFVYEAVALQANKHDFEQARSAIDSVYADIVSQVGQPDEYKIYNNCSVQHAEFENGPMSCNINNDFSYGVSDEKEASQILEKIQSILSNSNRFQLQGLGPELLKDNLVVNSYYHEAIDQYKSSRLNCVAKYIYDTPQETYLSVKDRSKKIFQINIGCYSSARQQYYPLAS